MHAEPSSSITLVNAYRAIIGIMLTAATMMFAPAVVSAEKQQCGQASWYGAKFAGKPTASGEIYDPTSMTAAHRTLAFGARVRVTRRDNGQSIIVRINNRGPFIKGRIIDLSAGAAQKLGYKSRGVTRVCLQVVQR